jgi:hypothetical protein
MNKENIIICRCEDISLADLEKIFAMGYHDIEVIKRLLRIGMGPCQGNTCGQLLQRELSNYLKIKTEDIKPLTSRPLVVGVKLKDINEGAIHEL